jgi:hypothetical protein
LQDQKNVTCRFVNLDPSTSARHLDESRRCHTDTGR